MQFELPKIEFLQYGNIYSSNYDDFNFKFVPNLENKHIEVFVWIGIYCLEATKEKVSNIFDLTEEGLDSANNWVLDEFEKYSTKQ